MFLAVLFGRKSVLFLKRGAEIGRGRIAQRKPNLFHRQFSIQQQVLRMFQPNMIAVFDWRRTGYLKENPQKVMRTHTGKRGIVRKGVVFGIVSVYVRNRQSDAVQIRPLRMVLLFVLPLSLTQIKVRNCKLYPAIYLLKIQNDNTDNST